MDMEMADCDSWKDKILNANARHKHEHDFEEIQVLKFIQFGLINVQIILHIN